VVTNAAVFKTTGTSLKSFKKLSLGWANGWML